MSAPLWLGEGATQGQDQSHPGDPGGRAQRGAPSCCGAQARVDTGGESAAEPQDPGLGEQGGRHPTRARGLRLPPCRWVVTGDSGEAGLCEKCAGPAVGQCSSLPSEPPPPPPTSCPEALSQEMPPVGTNCIQIVEGSLSLTGRSPPSPGGGPSAPRVSWGHRQPALSWGPRGPSEWLQAGPGCLRAQAPQREEQMASGRPSGLWTSCRRS